MWSVATITAAACHVSVSSGRRSVRDCHPSCSGDLQQSEHEWQRHLHTAYRRAGLLVNTKKTEVCCHLRSACSLLSPRRYPFKCKGVNVTQYITWVSDSWSLDSEVEHRIKATSSALGRLTKRVFLNHNLAIPTKVAVHRSCHLRSWFQLLIYAA